MNDRPNIVLVHGAWADGSSWSGVIERLQAKGFQVRAPQFPLSSLADDVARLRQVLEFQDGSHSTPCPSETLAARRSRRSWRTPPPDRMKCRSLAPTTRRAGTRGTTMPTAVVLAFATESAPHPGVDARAGDIAGISKIDTR